MNFVHILSQNELLGGQQMSENAGRIKFPWYNFQELIDKSNTKQAQQKKVDEIITHTQIYKETIP